MFQDAAQRAACASFDDHESVSLSGRGHHEIAGIIIGMNSGEWQRWKRQENTYLNLGCYPLRPAFSVIQPVHAQLQGALLFLWLVLVKPALKEKRLLPYPFEFYIKDLILPSATLCLKLDSLNIALAGYSKPTGSRYQNPRALRCGVGLAVLELMDSDANRCKSIQACFNSANMPPSVP